MSSCKSFVAAVFAFVGTNSVADAAALMTVSPTIGPPQTKVTVTVTGFAPGKFVDVYFDTTDQCLVLTNATGKGSCSFKAPAAPSKAYWISAVVRSTGTGLQKTFTIRSDWPHPHGLTASDDGFNRWESTLTPQNVGALDLAWTVLPTKSLQTTPVVYGGRIYVTSATGKLYAFNATTGATVAGFPKSVGPMAQYSSPVAADGKIYQASVESDGSSKIYAFDATTGATVSGFPVSMGGRSYGTVQVAGGKLWAGGADGKVYGFNAKTGATLANFPITLAGTPIIGSSLAYAGGLLYFGGVNGKFYAYNAVSGALIYSVTTTGYFDICSAAASNGAVYFANYGEHTLTALDGSTGSALWAAPLTLDGTLEAMPAIAGGRAFIADETGKVYAANVGNGQLLWSTLLGSVIVGPPVIANGVVWVGGNNSLFALDASSGAVLWRSKYSFQLGQNPVVVNGMVYAASANGGLRAYAVRGVSSTAASVAPDMATLKPNPALTAE
jgi:outer membrane protein assembly factor BamB